MTWAIRELAAISNRSINLNTEPPPLKTDSDACTGTERHTHEHAYTDDLCPATAGGLRQRGGVCRVLKGGRWFVTSGSKERPARTSGSGEGSQGPQTAGKGPPGTSSHWE